MVRDAFPLKGNAKKWCFEVHLAINAVFAIRQKFIQLTVNVPRSVASPSRPLAISDQDHGKVVATAGGQASLINWRIGACNSLASSNPKVTYGESQVY